MHVPSSKDGRLVKMLAKAEPRIAKITGYQVKFIEKSGRKLSSLFNVDTEVKCFRSDCAVCINSDQKTSSKCQMKGVVYLGICTLCDAEHRLKNKNKHEGLYVGETSRTLSERAREHREAFERLDPKSFMLKHWSTKHHTLNTPPEFVFKVVKKHNDALGRLVHEAVKILD